MKEHLYYTYIMASRSRNLYIGMTSQIEIRNKQHKDGTFEGYSKDYNCNRLVYFERHPYVNDAIAREKQLKGWTRVKKIWLIERTNPTWLDLSAEWGTYRFYRGEAEAPHQNAGPSTTPAANTAPDSAQDDNSEEQS